MKTSRPKESGNTVNEGVLSAEGFLIRCLRSGLAHSFVVATRKWVKPYPEVTGYLLSYFADTRKSSEIPNAILGAARRLIDIQDKTGGYHSFRRDGFLYTFDTAQIMSGLVSMYRATEDKTFLDHAVMCADFVCDMQLPNGAMFPIYDLGKSAAFVYQRGDWGARFSYIQTKNIEGLQSLCEITGEDKYRRAAEKLAAFGKHRYQHEFTHPGAYCLEGLWAIGERRLVRYRLEQEIIPQIQENGYLAYSPALPYAYVSGSVQMGILLFKAGFKGESRRILDWARRVQSRHESGGLFQYADAGANLDTHVHSEINSWGTKYYCQLERLWEFDD